MGGAFFLLDPQAVLVSGARRGAIYNLASGNVYSVDEAGYEILDLARRGVPVSEIDKHTTREKNAEVISAYLGEIEALGLGRFSSVGEPQAAESMDADLHSVRRIWLELTDHCNLQCIHCYAAAERGGRAPVDLSLFLKAIAEAAELGAEWIQLIGGEPLLCPRTDWTALIRAARTAKYATIEIFTNGTLIGEADARTFAGEGVQAAISLYSCRAEIHDTITRCPGSFGRTVRAIELLRARGVPVRIGLVVMKQNRSTESETLEWLRARFGDIPVSTDVVRCTSCGRAESDLLTPDLLRRSIRATPEFPSISRSCYLRNRGGQFCYQDAACVHPDGTVYPCVMDRNHLLGSLHERSLRQMVAGAPAQQVRGTTKDRIAVCRDCEYRYACIDCPPMIAALAGGREGDPTEGVKNPLCLYDPYAGEWGNPDAALERLARGGRPDVKESEYA